MLHPVKNFTFEFYNLLQCHVYLRAAVATCKLFLLLFYSLFFVLCPSLLFEYFPKHQYCNYCMWWSLLCRQSLGGVSQVVSRWCWWLSAFAPTCCYILQIQVILVSFSYLDFFFFGCMLLVVIDISVGCCWVRGGYNFGFWILVAADFAVRWWCLKLSCYCWYGQKIIKYIILM